MPSGSSRHPRRRTETNVDHFEVPVQRLLGVFRRRRLERKKAGFFNASHRALKRKAAPRDEKRNPRHMLRIFKTPTDNFTFLL